MCNVINWKKNRAYLCKGVSNKIPQTSQQSNVKIVWASMVCQERGAVILQFRTLFSIFDHHHLISRELTKLLLKQNLFCGGLVFFPERQRSRWVFFICLFYKKCFIVSGRSFFSELVLTYALNCKLRCTKFKITFRVSRPRFVDGAKHIFRVASIDLLAKCTRYSTERQLEQSFKLPLYDFCCYKLLGSSTAQNLNKKVWLFYQLAYLYTAACKGNTESKLYWVIRLQPSSSTLWHPRRNQQTLSSIVFS